MNKDVEITTLQETTSKALSKKDEEEYLDSMDKLAELYLEKANASLQQLRYMDASEFFTEAVSVYEDVGKYLQGVLNKPRDIQSEDEKPLEFTKQLKNHVSNRAEFMKAMVCFFKGEAYNLDRNPGVACKYFKQAHKKFKILSDNQDNPIFNFFADYTTAMIMISEGAEDVILGNFNTAKMSFQRAQFLISEIERKSLPLIKDAEEQFTEILQRGLLIDNIGCETLYCLADAKDQFSRGNYSEAAEQFSRLEDSCQQVLQQISGHFPETLYNLYLGEYCHYRGYRCLAEGEALREQERWDEAFQQYAKVREIWKEGAAAYTKSDHPLGLAMQVFLINETSKISEQYIKRCKDDQDHKTQIRELKNQLQTMIDSISKTGVTVTNSQEMVSMVEQNVQIMQKLEENLKENIRDLLHELNDVTLPEKDREYILHETNELMAPGKKGNEFLENAKIFTENLKKIVNNVGDTARPLLPFVKALSVLL